MDNLRNCPICQDTLDFDSKMLPCEHTYHTTCLKQLYNSTKGIQCSICRKPTPVIKDGYSTIEALPPGIILQEDVLRQGRGEQPISKGYSNYLQQVRDENLSLNSLLRQKENVIDKYETGLIVGGTVLAGVLLGAGIYALCGSGSQKKERESRY